MSLVPCRGVTDNERPWTDRTGDRHSGARLGQRGQRLNWLIKEGGASAQNGWKEDRCRQSMTGENMTNKPKERRPNGKVGRPWANALKYRDVRIQSSRGRIAVRRPPGPEWLTAHRKNRRRMGPVDLTVAWSVSSKGENPAGHASVERRRPSDGGSDTDCRSAWEDAELTGEDDPLEKPFSTETKH